MDIFFSAKHLIWPDMIRLPFQTFFVCFCFFRLIHEWTSEQVKSVNNAVVVLKLLPEAFCNPFILKSSSLRSCAQTKAQNVSCSKCLYFAFFCQIFNFLSAIFCLRSCLQNVGVFLWAQFELFDWSYEDWTDIPELCVMHWRLCPTLVAVSAHFQPRW